MGPFWAIPVGLRFKENWKLCRRFYWICLTLQLIYEDWSPFIEFQRRKVIIFEFTDTFPRDLLRLGRSETVVFYAFLISRELKQEPVGVVHGVRGREI
ncbi:hypothetical protein HS088_TW04G00250 [Tripterygium wilfordii]|uniref:Uncharacterized protein n=1 Tax=Tripterygium wilfordii TaxID=458696 RepID=A0A7J7DPM4_TRIWF|nr:hypothetical protein HS088_TW04G00250 [Tripterygium wilfordii]